MATRNAGTLGEVRPWGRLTPTKPLWDIPCQSESPQTVNSGWPWAVKGKFLSVHSSAESYFPFDLALGRGKCQFKGFAVAFLWVQSRQLGLLHEGNAAGAGAFHSLLCPSSPGPQDTPSRATCALSPRIHSQHSPLSTEVLYLCMPRSYSYALQQMLYGSSVISTLHHHARGTDLISCSLSWQGMGALLRQCAKPPDGQGKGIFFPLLCSGPYS